MEDNFFFFLICTLKFHASVFVWLYQSSYPSPAACSALDRGVPNSLGGLQLRWPFGNWANSAGKTGGRKGNGFWRRYFSVVPFTLEAQRAFRKSLECLALRQATADSGRRWLSSKTEHEGFVSDHLVLGWRCCGRWGNIKLVFDRWKKKKKGWNRKIFKPEFGAWCMQIISITVHHRSFSLLKLIFCVFL